MKFLVIMAVLAGAPKVTVLTPGTEAKATLFCTEEAQFIEDTNNLEEHKQMKKKQDTNTGSSIIWVVAGVTLGLITGYVVAKAGTK